MAHLLGAEAVHIEFPTRVVFDAVTLGVAEGDRIGLVGRNGDGKSTLLNILSGQLEPDAGQVTTRRNLTIGVLAQRDSLDDAQTVSHAIVGDAADHEWASNAQIRDVLAGLVNDVGWDATIGSLSGGQRRRVALAQLLVGDDDVLFLDEPTNHLDVEGIAWLAGHLKTRWSASAGALLVVTHDRWFLDEVCNTTWEVHDRIVEPFEGGYAAYILQRLERDRQNATIEGKRRNLMRKELAWLRRGAPARTAKPKFRIDAANDLIANEPEPRNAIALASMAMQRLGKDVVDLENIGVVFDEHTVLADVTWRLAPGERTGILGVNGAGKSTLLSLVAGSLAPTTGRVKRGKTVKVAMLTQQLFELDDMANDRVSEVVGRKKSTYQTEGKEMTPGQLLERLGFTSAQLSTPVKDLSGGQRRRLQLMLILLDEPNVLILDEPTNDLDTDMLVAMEDLLDTWPGTLIVVSHDRYLLERVTDQQYAIIDAHLRHLTGGVDQYLALRAGFDTSATRTTQPAGSSAERSRGLSSAEAVSKSPTAGAPAERAMPPGSAERRAAEKEVQAIDRKLAKLEALRAAVHERLAQADQSNFAALTELTNELRDHDTETADLEARWLILSSQLEA
ncbi:MAG: ATP-binding cassette domain-containing protein [Aurantimicrobium sp.]|nr:ATP-binding cassette domain-containing protein [Aurantimicrobium sp.]